MFEAIQPVVHEVPLLLERVIEVAGCLIHSISRVSHDLGGIHHPLVAHQIRLPNAGVIFRRPAIAVHRPQAHPMLISLELGQERELGSEAEKVLHRRESFPSIRPSA